MIRPAIPYAFAVGAAAIAAPGLSAEITVCQSGCDSTTIQGAITLASHGDTISVNHIGQWTESGILVDESVEIAGLSESTTTVQAAATTPTASDRVFDIPATAEVTIRDMTIRHGNNIATGGGCIRNNGTMKLERVTVTDCRTTAANGGGILNSGFFLELDNVTVRNSVSQGSSSNGGGLFNAGTLDADGCEIHNNSTSLDGAGLYNTDTALLDNCWIHDNGSVSPQDASGIFTEGILGVLNSRVGPSTERAPTIIINDGTSVIERTTIRNTRILAVAVNGDARADIKDSVIRDNDGIGLLACSDNPVDLVNSTVSGNTSELEGGISVCASRTIRIVNSTIADNVADVDADGFGDGGGIYLEPPSGCNPFCVITKAEIRNSIVANNTDNSPSGNLQAHDCAGTLHSDGYNLVEDSSTSNEFAPCFVDGDTSGVIVQSAPQLGSLADNFGPTWTHALQPGSPAIDAGNPAGCTDFVGNPLEHDQRGAPHINTCDLGAFEFGSAPPIFSDRFEH